jgi:hypothetical protein
MPTISDLINVIQSMQADNNNMAAKINALELDKQKLENSVKDLNAKDIEMTLALNNSRHIEHGTMNCGNSPTWSSNNWPEKISNYWNGIQHDKIFQRAYDNPPIVFLSVHQRVYSAAGISLDLFKPGYDISVSKVDTKGFTVRCLAYKSVSQYLIINWISIPTS